MTPRGGPAVEVLAPGYARWDLVLALILDAFAYMEGVIDPPSSALRLDERSLRDKAAAGTALAVLDGGRPVACLFCDRRGDTLYLGKLAVEGRRRGRGLASALIGAAEAMARGRGMKALELQTRVELVANHAFFAARGFAAVAEGRHEGYDRPTWIVMRKPLGTVEDAAAAPDRMNGKPQPAASTRSRRRSTTGW